MKYIVLFTILLALSSEAAGLFNGPTIQGGSTTGGTGTTPAQVAAQISTNNAATMVMVNNSMSSGTNAFAGNGSGITSLIIPNGVWRPTGGTYTLTQTMTNVVFGSQYLALTNLTAGTYEIGVKFLYTPDTGSTNDIIEWKLYNQTSSETYSDFYLAANYLTGPSQARLPFYLSGRVVLTNTSTLFFQMVNDTAVRGTIADNTGSIRYMKLQ